MTNRRADSLARAHSIGKFGYERQCERTHKGRRAPRWHGGGAGNGKLADKVARITGGDSGIGRATAIDCAKAGADIAIVYVNEHADVEETKRPALPEEIGPSDVFLAADDPLT